MPVAAVFNTDATPVFTVAFLAALAAAPTAFASARIVAVTAAFLQGSMFTFVRAFAAAVSFEFCVSL